MIIVGIHDDGLHVLHISQYTRASSNLPYLAGMPLHHTQESNCISPTEATMKSNERLVGNFTCATFSILTELRSHKPRFEHSTCLCAVFNEDGLSTHAKSYGQITVYQEKKRMVQLGISEMRAYRSKLTLRAIWRRVWVVTRASAVIGAYATGIAVIRASCPAHGRPESE
jgi:hypothetical protein